MNKRVRIFLNEDGTNHLHLMVKDIRKYKGVSVTPSELGSWALSFFYQNYFEKLKPDIVKSFTDFKKLVRDSLRNASSQEELINSLKSSLAKTQTIKKKLNDKAEIKTNQEELKDK